MTAGERAKRDNAGVMAKTKIRRARIRWVRAAALEQAARERLDAELRAGKRAGLTIDELTALVPLGRAIVGRIVKTKKTNRKETPK
jgi:hypothetical protein